MDSTHYQEVQPERDVSGNNFSKGQINFNWTMDSRGYFNPYQSFLKIRCSLSKANGDQLDVSDNIAPSMFMADNLFQTMQVQLNNVVISEIGDYVPQIASLKQRMYQSDSHLNTYTAQTNFSQAAFCDRQQQVIDTGSVVGCEETTGSLDLGFKAPATYALGPTVGQMVFADAGGTVPTLTDVFQIGDTVEFEDLNNPLLIQSGEITSIPSAIAIQLKGSLADPIAQTEIVVTNKNLKRIRKQDSRRVKTFELIWRPCLGFFDIDGYLPSMQGLYNLRLTPHPEGVYQKFAIESIGANKIPNTDFKFNIESIHMYILKGIGPAVVSKSLCFEVNEIRCQSQNLTTNSVHQKTFQVHPNSHALTIAYQESGAGNNDTTLIASKFTAASDNHLKLRRFWLRYGGKQLPTPIPDILFSKLTAQDFIVQRYNESLMYANLSKMMYNPEPLEKWVERGPYYHFCGYSKEMKSDRVYISQQFDEFVGNKPNVLLFDHYKKKVNITISNSILQNVSISENGN
jgi:hypothetical protein